MNIKQATSFFLFAATENTSTILRKDDGLLLESMKEILRQKEKLAEKIEILTDYYGLPSRRLLSSASLIKTISSLSCENRIMYIISNNALSEENRKFDVYYRQKSSFATIKILDRVKTALSAAGLEATIFAEVSADSARYDAVIALGRLSKIERWDSGTVRVEIKGSLGMDFEQLGRYLWNRSPLILVRVITGHVVKIYPSELQSYVTFSLNELVAKIDRLISQKHYALPGTDCVDCPNIKCAYWQDRNRRRKTNFVALSDMEFGQDLTLFFQNLSYAAERTALMVVEELQDVSRQSKVGSFHTQVRVEKNVQDKRIVESNDEGQSYERLA
jgi:hypothetical protein